MTRFRRILAALAAAAVPAGAAASPGRPRLVSPAGASVVLPGERVEIAVAGTPDGADEWEAFLSLDGGRTYPLRATPHLPADERAFPWTVPELPPGSVRVKVRFGVAGVEREYLLPEIFSIGSGESGALVAPDPAAVGLSPASGEEDTVAWVDRVDGRSRLVVPVSERGVTPASAWSTAPRVPLPAPRRVALAPPDRPAGARLAVPPPAISPAAPLRRTIASLSRRNV